MKIIERLETLRRLNRDPNWVNDNIFRLVCSPQMAILAYERIKSIPGNMTAGDDGATLDHISLAALDKLCDSIRDGSYRPKPVRRKFIPKANGKERPLGIPSPRDKIVQEMIREILESIYDSGASPTFSSHSHGFRPDLGCHTAIQEFTKWNGVTWLVEGDIKGFFDNIDHHILISLLRRRIKDERFINLVWSFLRAGIRELDGSLSSNKLGTPQGGIISPILANVYLHEFDVWVEKLRSELQKGARRKPNPEWRKLIRKKDYLIATGKATKDSEEVKQLERAALLLPTVSVDDPDFCRVFYVRYADDWMIGITGSKELAEDVKSRATEFLATVLKLELSAEKTLITHAKTEEANFLGFRLSIGGSVKRMRVKAEGQRSATKRVTGWLPRVDVPTKALVARLNTSGFCHTLRGTEFFPRSKRAFVGLEDHEIVMRFNSIWRGIYNYYCVCNNANKLDWVMYILQYSCLMTLSHKHRIRVPRAIKKYGVYPQIKYKAANGEEKVVGFWRPPVWRQPFMKQQKQLDLDIVLAQANRMTRSHLGSPCAVCGSKTKVEMHHVRALRKGNKTITNGFNKIMSAINRKQIPVCYRCHDEIHAGRYDDLKLSALAYVPQ